MRANISKNRRKTLENLERIITSNQQKWTPFLELEFYSA